jgi:hypothetical protein
VIKEHRRVDIPFLLRLVKLDGIGPSRSMILQSY